MSRIKKWIEYAKYIKSKDPAAKSLWEVFFLYPGFKALVRHEKAHKLYNKGKYFRARRISEKTKKLTGIEIHPGAKIGEYVVIDHGDGIVIGETAIIGNYVQLYQGVSLAADGDTVGERRHPLIEDNVMLGAGSIVLGPLTVGKGAKIGAGAVVLKDIPAYTTAVGVPAKILDK